MASQRPVLLFDGGCGFCRIWVDYWRQLTGDRIEYAASQQSRGRFPQIPENSYATSVQLVMPNGIVFSGARAVFESLGKTALYRPLAGPLEAGYRMVAGNRNFFERLTHLCFGKEVEPTRFAATQWLFLRALALIYIVAFSSLALQVKGLLGSHGVVPAVEFLANVAKSGSNLRYLAVPSIFWLGADDGTLLGISFGGIALGIILLITGFRSAKFERLVLVLLYILYLSFAAIGQEFFSFQWDSLLLETGFLAIFLANNRWIPWLFRWLGFRLMFLSGAVKLLSGDANWRNLSALRFHWHTQPLPTALAWYADKLPSSFSASATAATLAIELVVPFCVFLPRRIRMLGAWILTGLQLLIILTGNYTFFNLLAMALLLFWFDDRALRRFVPGAAGPLTLASTARIVWVPRLVSAVVLFLGLSHLIQTFSGKAPGFLGSALRYTAPLQIVNTYGLFAVMTTERKEIVLEGSADGEHWTPYEFRYKPGALNQAPRWVAPHQPRLDWQMWFAALGDFRDNIWLVNLAVRLLEGSPDVIDLLASNPFPSQPPKFVRAVSYNYTFTDWASRRRTGEWWKREPHGVYLPSVGLRVGVGQ